MTPIYIAGVSAKPIKFRYGNQFQYWEKMSIPTTAYIFGNPDRVVNETHIFLPPISSNPTLIIAPNFAITSTWDLPIISSIVFLKSANLG